MLYIISTPIGNLKDITLRALEMLNSVSLIVAEDTRRTLKLLHHYKIKNKLISYNDFNKRRVTPKLIKLLKQNRNIALVSNAGTPSISDPGYYLIRACIKNDIKVTHIPGATALISALVCSGLPTDKFLFYGFLPKKKKKKLLYELKDLKITTIFYESPHRIKETLAILNEIMPKKGLVIARELTKKFEEFIRGSVRDVYEKTKNLEIKGEIVLVLY